MRRLLSVCALLLASTALSSCTTLNQLAALRGVDFGIDRVGNTFLAGIDMQDVRSLDDLSTAQGLVLASNIARGELPLDLTLFLDADNPESNPAARLVEMDWTLFLEGRQTISGTFNDEIALPSGQTTQVPIRMRLDLVEFFGNNLGDLLELAAALSGEQGGQSKNIRLQANPTLQTAIGPIRMGEITILQQQVGN
jgi:hypothetical protein